MSHYSPYLALLTVEGSLLSHTVSRFTELPVLAPFDLLGYLLSLPFSGLAPAVAISGRLIDLSIFVAMASYLFFAYVAYELYRAINTPHTEIAS